MPPQPACRESLPRATSPITCTARRSPRRARAAWRRSMRTAILRDSTLASPSAIRSSVHAHIDALARREWNALAGTHIPFLRHEFLAALEHTDCLGAASGWEPRDFTLTHPPGLPA